jgi:hypothetical protein
MSSLGFRADGFTGGRPANRGGISIIALFMSTATGFNSVAWLINPSRCASSGRAPPPANGSWNTGRTSARKSSFAPTWVSFSAQVLHQLFRISSRASASSEYLNTQSVNDASFDASAHEASAGSAGGTGQRCRRAGWPPSEAPRTSKPLGQPRRRCTLIPAMCQPFRAVHRT